MVEQHGSTAQKLPIQSGKKWQSFCVQILPLGFSQVAVNPKKLALKRNLCMSVRTTKQGIPVYYCIGLEDVNDHGGANAEGLKSCLDKTFEDLGIQDNGYLKCMVSATADGASVNTGIHSGLLTRLKK